MNITITKIVFLALTLILIPSTTAAAKGSHGDKEHHKDGGYHQGKGHDESKGYHEKDGHHGDREKKHNKDRRYRRGKKHKESKGYREKDGHHGDRGEHGRRLLSKVRLQDSVCNDVDGKWARGLCYAYCEALDCYGDSPRGSADECMKLKENYYKMTDIPLPCVPVTAASCPCFGDLDTVFNGTSITCSPDVNPTLIWDDNGTQVQASVDPSFLACIGENGITKLDSLEEASGCLNMIQDFCSVP